MVVFVLALVLAIYYSTMKQWVQLLAPGASACPGAAAAQPQRTMAATSSS